MENLMLTDRELADIEASENQELKTMESRQVNKLEENKRKKKKIQEDLDYLQSNKITLLKTGAFTPEAIVSEEKKLSGQLSVLEELEQSSSFIKDTLKEIKKLSELLKHLCFLYQHGNPYEKDEIIRLLFSELSVYENTLSYKGRNGIQGLESRFHPSCAPNHWLSELGTYSDCIKISIKEIEELLQTDLDRNNRVC